MSFSRSETVELLVPTMVDCPSTANCTVGELGTVRIHDNHMVFECFQLFSLGLLWFCHFVGVWRNGLRETQRLYRNRSVERIKGNQATFDNSQRNNLRSCLWVSSVVFGLSLLSSGRERSTYIGTGQGQIWSLGLTIAPRLTNPHLSVGTSETPIGPGRYWR